MLAGIPNSGGVFVSQGVVFATGLRLHSRGEGSAAATHERYPISGHSAITWSRVRIYGRRHAISRDPGKRNRPARRGDFDAGRCFKLGGSFVSQGSLATGLRLLPRGEGLLAATHERYLISGHSAITRSPVRIHGGRCQAFYTGFTDRCDMCGYGQEIL